MWEDYLSQAESSLDSVQAEWCSAKTSQIIIVDNCVNEEERTPAIRDNGV